MHLLCTWGTTILWIWNKWISTETTLALCFSSLKEREALKLNLRRAVELPCCKIFLTLLLCFLSIMIHFISFPEYSSSKLHISKLTRGQAESLRFGCWTLRTKWDNISLPFSPFLRFRIKVRLPPLSYLTWPFLFQIRRTHRSGAETGTESLRPWAGACAYHNWSKSWWWSNKKDLERCGCQVLWNRLLLHRTWGKTAGLVLCSLKKQTKMELQKPVPAGNFCRELCSVYPPPAPCRVFPGLGLGGYATVLKDYISACRS